MENTEKQEPAGGSHHTSKIIGALLLGGVLGAGIGLLLAPDSGDGTRKKIWDELKDTLGNLKDKVGEHHCPGCNCQHKEETPKQA